MTKNDLYKESFKTLVLEGIANNTYIGIGNPNSPILIVGKEGSELYKQEDEISFAKDWLPKIENNEISFRKFKKSDLVKGYSGEGHTWNKYQKLHDKIFTEYMEKREKNEINFEERIFTTEMNINRSKSAKNAPKDGMQERKDTFFRSDFIQQFPVIILACGDYIKNNNTVREIDDIFGVEFDREFKTNQSFWTHYNPDKTKLVIHTRQLSIAVSEDLLKNMAIVIREHLKI